MRSCAFLCAVAGLAIAGSATADVTDINGIVAFNRIFNDRPASTLVVTNNYPTSYRIQESDPGAGGFANRHTGYYSNDGGATRRDFDYNELFDISVTMNLTTDPVSGVSESGFQFDLFGLGRFGVITADGRIEADGSVIPNFNFGPGIIQNGTVSLRMIHRPGSGNGFTPIGAGQRSTMEYLYDIGSGYVSSGLVEFNNTEGGIPEIPFNDFYIGVGSQNNFSSGLNSADALFTNFSNLAVPAPSAAALLGLGGLLVARRRR